MTNVMDWWQTGCYPNTFFTCLLCAPWVRVFYIYSFDDRVDHLQYILIFKTIFLDFTRHFFGEGHRFNNRFGTGYDIACSKYAL